MCASVHIWGGVPQALCVPVEVDLTAFCHGESWKTQVEGKSFVGALEAELPSLLAFSILGP